MQKLEKKLNKESFKFLKELVKSWQYSWKDIKEKVNIENWGIIWKWNLNIRRTKVKKVKAKRIEWNLNIEWVESLEEIEVEEIWWDLYIEETKVKKVKVKKIGWYLDAFWLKSLEEIEVEEEIGWYLDISWTKIKKIKAKRIRWYIDAEWAKNLEDIEIEKEIGWNLDINRTKIDFQKKILEKIKKWELKVSWKVVF